MTALEFRRLLLRYEFFVILAITGLTAWGFTEWMKSRGELW